ncbi:MAG: hypothetical protein ACLT76_18365 [Clostridium fessum]
MRQWKQEEIARLKAEQGIAEVEEPGVNHGCRVFSMLIWEVTEMQVKVMNRVYRMSQEEYQGLLKMASDQVPFGVYAIEKKGYAELRNDKCQEHEPTKKS